MDVLTKIQKQIDCDIVATQTLGGGCISHALKVTTSSGQVYFAKANSNLDKSAFIREAEGLALLRKYSSFRIPKVFHVDAQFLLLEYIEPHRTQNDFYYRMGRMLAEMHLAKHEISRFGFAEDGLIGSMIQHNKWTDNWLDFWREQRLKPQLKWASSILPKEELDAWSKVLTDLPKILGKSADEPPSLLHGDLWGGNHFADSQGLPVLIDPAAYFGNREADLAMTKMFHRFPDQFYMGYGSLLPIEPDFWNLRIYLYLAYHYLNHINLFGSGYQSGLHNCLQQIVKAL